MGSRQRGWVKTVIRVTELWIAHCFKVKIEDIRSVMLELEIDADEAYDVIDNLGSFEPGFCYSLPIEDAIKVVESIKTRDYLERLDKVTEQKEAAEKGSSAT